MSSVRYVPPFATIKQNFVLTSARDRVNATIEYEALRDVIRLLLQGVTVDEQWYLKQYPDIAQAVRDGVVPSGRAHFISDGYFEGRLPFELEVDGAWYAETYPDISEAVARREFASVEEHFRNFGYQEGRLPGAAA